ncbi:MAG: leucine-rich repeat domain-containing protein [Bacteroidaceae bacterium]|nr:leucine-rich repeat domain-containing protein [Bacteroidaceae bacterium]
MHKYIFLLLLSFSTTSFAYDFEVNGFYYNFVDGEMWDVDYPCVEITYDKTISWKELREKNASIKSLTIPDTVRYDGILYRVIGIGMSAFSQCPALSSLTLPEGLIYIDDNAFSGRKPLSSITIPNSVTTIGNYAFSECANLRSVYIPDDVFYLGMGAFEECKRLQTVHLPPGITSIPSSLFSGCEALDQVNIPEGVTSIGATAFVGCRINSLKLPNTLKRIDMNAFAMCLQLESLHLPDGLKEIGAGVFKFCSRLSHLDIPESVDYIGREAFFLCGIQSFTSPAALSVIGEYTFHYAGINTLTIMPNITSIKQSAFECCENLKTVRIEGGEVELDRNVFVGCHAISDIYCLTDGVPKADSLAFAKYELIKNNNDFMRYIIGQCISPTGIAEQATLHVHKSLLNRFKNTYPWSEFKSIVAIEDETAIGPIAINDESSSTRRVYDLVGRLRRAAQPGLNVIVGGDGRSRKVMVK